MPKVRLDYMQTVVYPDSELWLAGYICIPETAYQHPEPGILNMCSLKLNF